MGYHKNCRTTLIDLFEKSAISLLRSLRIKVTGFCPSARRISGTIYQCSRKCNLCCSPPESSSGNDLYFLQVLLPEAPGTRLLDHTCRSSDDTLRKCNVFVMPLRPFSRRKLGNSNAKFTAVFCHTAVFHFSRRSPLTIIWPLVLSSFSAYSLIRVVLPDPLLPTTKTNSSFI